MIAELGNVFTGLALIATLYGAVAALICIVRDDHRWWQSSQHAFVSVAALLGTAVVILIEAFLVDAFDVRYVALHSSRAVPVYLKISAVWAGQEGSLLLWSFLQALFAMAAVVWPTRDGKRLAPWAAVVLSAINAFFIGVTLLASNPFTPLPQAPVDGQGLNPLLRHPGMIIHPPMLYIGYVGLAVPFAFSMAALILGDAPRWTVATRTWALIAWLGLSLGLLLGMRWAYDVLGWGGYWGWDPVENAGLMPWFTATAFLHGAVMQDERRGFRAWNHILALVSFVLVLFGTFATRSGVIASVHAYARSSIGGIFLAGIFATLAVASGLLVWRRHELRSRDIQAEEPLLSRDGLFFLTLLIFGTLTLSVFLGSTLPTLTGALFARRFEAGPEWFDRVTGPQFAALVVLLGLCPLVGRAAAATRRLRRRWWVPMAGAVGAPLLAAVSGFTRPLSMLGFAFTGLAAATILLEFGEATAKRVRGQGEPLLNAVWKTIRHQRRRYGGYLVHLGVVLMAVGVIGTRLYPLERDIVLEVGELQPVGGYDLGLAALSRDAAGDYVSTVATVTVGRGGDVLATLLPRVNRFANYDQAFTVPAIRPTLREDLHVTLAGWSVDGTSATLEVVVNALVNFLWLGGLVLLVGGGLALWPSTASRTWTIVAFGVLVALIAGAGWAMWGAPAAADVVDTSAAVAVGLEAPDFTLQLLEGSALSLADLEGQVVVLNLWAAWCSTCKGDLPRFVEADRAYSESDVTFIGVAYDTDRDAALEVVQTYGIAYAVGLDEGGRIAKAYRITGVPETFVIDRDGRLAHAQTGPWAPGQLMRVLDEVVGRP